MGLQDKSVVRSAAELEKKYNLTKLLGMASNVELNKESLVKIENELNNMLNSLIINLGDVLDSQSDISLWFYSGIPTTENEPYINWEVSTEHIGDLYYDKSTGYVYQYKEVDEIGLWEINTNPDLIEAMAITNSEIDTSTDHERKVFFETPIIPYSNGDWWVKEDGSVFMCQITKTEGEYEENDFVNSSNYTESIATKLGEEIKVLKGTITMISESYAKFTDLATGGSTIIAGENITTGNIKSANYVSGTSGMKIDLDNGILDSKNLKLSEDGTLDVGGYIKTEKGVIANLQFNSNQDFLGQTQVVGEGVGIDRGTLVIFANIPKNFEVISAKLTLKTFKTKNTYLDNTTGAEISNYGKVKNIRLYKQSNSAEISHHWYLATVSIPNAITEVSGAFGTNGFSATTTEGERVESIDIKNSLDSTTVLWLRTADSALNGDTTSGVTSATQQSQLAYATLDVIGYIKLT